ncbi:hypothetical protein HD806DRAFT_130213 [Xylariaceae sp. AK1471]|nr:hypothetical protein HD806DRAFT_130213 [Xylariaceae sp. AK1471]
MKSTSVAAAAAVLAGMSIAQPHGQHGHQHLHAKRELVTEWETVWETVTVLVDETATQTILPTHPADSGAPGEFFQPSPSSTSTPEPTPQPTVVETPSVEAPAPPPTTTAEASSPPPPPPPPAPTTTPTPEPAPAPVPTSVEAPAPPAESSSAPASGSSSGSNGASYSGDITYYTVGLGACGYDDSGKDNSANIVAIAKPDWERVSTLTNSGPNSPTHPWCDKTITIKAPNGKSTTAIVRDNCPGCVSGSIDVSEKVFITLFGSLDAGRTEMTWSFN